MSSDLLYVEFADGARLWGIYYGTSDCILPRLFATRQEAEEAFFKEDGAPVVSAVSGDAKRRAEATAEPVRFFTSYGVFDRGFRELDWNGHASRVEKAIVGPYENPWVDEWPNDQWTW